MQDADLARAVNISPRRLSYYVNDEREPPLPLLVAIAKAIGVDCSELLTPRHDGVHFHDGTITHGPTLADRLRAALHLDPADDEEEIVAAILNMPRSAHQLQRWIRHHRDLRRQLRDEIEQARMALIRAEAIAGRIAEDSSLDVPPASDLETPPWPTADRIELENVLVEVSREANVLVGRLVDDLRFEGQAPLQWRQAGRRPRVPQHSLIRAQGYINVSPSAEPEIVLTSWRPEESISET